MINLVRFELFLNVPVTIPGSLPNIYMREYSIEINNDKLDAFVQNILISSLYSTEMNFSFIKVSEVYIVLNKITIFINF